MSTNPSTNEERCGNCGTVNPIGQDKCIKCGMPLTGAAGQGLRTHLAIEDDAAVIGGSNEISGLGSGLTSADMDDPSRPGTGLPFFPDRPA